MVWPFESMLNTLETWGFLFNLMLGLLLIRLRYMSEDHPLTKSQRWALSIAAWLYLVNSLQILFEVLLNMGEGTFGVFGHEYITHMRAQFNLIATLCLLGFGLVYPSLAMRWSRLRYLLLAIGIIWIPFVILLFRYDFTILNSLFAGGIQMLSITYLPACFIPIFLWLPVYWKHNSPQMDSTLSLLIWGYLFSFVVLRGSSIIIGVYTDTGSRSGILDIILVIIVLILLLKTIYHKRGQWATAEKLNLALLIVSVSMAILWAVIQINMGIPEHMETGPLYQFIWFFAGGAGWMILRPILFSYGILRFQFFGPKVNVARYFEMVIAVVFSSFIALLSIYFIGKYNPLVATLVCLVIFFGLLYPCFKLSKVIVTRSLPMSEGGANAPLAERRSTYLMGLQTAVVDGEINDPDDQEVLERLREDLHVSKREHDLLMDGFLKDRPQMLREQLEEAYLFHKNGMLLGYVSREGRTGGEKEGLMATMLTTVGKFAQDALKKGSHSVESIEYGNITLIVEAEEDIALGVILSGKDNPQVRQSMRDVLGNINKEYSPSIEKASQQDSFEQMQEAKKELKGLEKLMRRFITEGGG